MNPYKDFLVAILAPLLIAVALFLAWISSRDDDDDDNDWPQHGCHA